MGRLENKVCVITGAGMGIGRGLARRFAGEGARVLVAELDPEAGERVAAEVRELGADARFVHTDVTEKEQVQAAIAEAVSAWGSVHILVNNAWGGSNIARLEWKTDDDMMHGLKTGFLSVFWAMQAVFPHMKAAGWGRVITMCSLNGINAHRYTVMYNGSKEAARSLTRTAAVEWGRYGITCNVLCPFAATPSWQGFEKFDPEGARAIVEGNPIRYAGDPEQDIGPVVVFLASEESRYVTGNTLHADGGGHINGVGWRMELPE